MPTETTSLQDAFAEFCQTYLDRITTRATLTDGTFQAGLARFTLHEQQPFVADFAAKQFVPLGAAGPDDRVSQIHVIYEALPQHPIVDLLDQIGFAAVQTLFADIGMSGFYHAERRHLEFYDPKRRIGLRVLPAPESSPVWENSAPLANFVAWMNAAADGIMVHAATLANEVAGALICGPGGRGKSLLTLAGLAAGLETVGDDYVVVNHTAGRYRAWSCARTAKQSPQGLAMLGAGGEVFRTGPLNWQNKHVFALPERRGGGAVPLDVIVVPTLAAGPTITPARRGAVFRQLTESTLYQLALDRRLVAEFCGLLVRDLPVFDFAMGPDLAANVACLDAFLTRQVAA